MFIICWTYRILDKLKITIISNGYEVPTVVVVLEIVLLVLAKFN